MKIMCETELTATVVAKQRSYTVPRDVADELARLTSEVARLREDAARLDRLELTIRDGSFARILNDIIAFCQVAYKGIGPGPALRTAIDATMPAAKP